MSSATQLADAFAVGVNQTYGPKLGMSTGIGIGSYTADTNRLFPDGVPSLWKIGGSAGAPSYIASALPAPNYNTPVGYVKALADIPNGGSQGAYVNNTGNTVKAGQYFWGTGTLATTLIVGSGSGGHGIWTPDAPALSVLANQPWDQRWLMTPNLWVPTASDGFAGQVGPGFSPVKDTCFHIQRSSGTHQLIFSVGRNGSSTVSATKVFPSWADATQHWIRWTYIPATGFTDFFWSDDGVAWTSVGGQTYTSTTLLNDSVRPVAVGMNGLGSLFNSVAGKYQRYELRSPINGPLIAGFDASQAVAGAAACAGFGGEVWTLSNMAAFVNATAPAVKLILPGGWQPVSCVTTPDTAAFTPMLTTSWEYRALMSSPSWGSLTQQICGQSDGTAPNSSWWSDWRSSRTVEFGVYAPASGGPASIQSATYPSWAANTEHWIRVTYNAATSIVSFYWSDDGSAWTLVNAPSMAPAAAAQDSTLPLRVGHSDGTPQNGVQGYIRRFELRSPIGGAIIAGWDASQALQSALTAPGLNGETWSTVGNAFFVG